MPPLRPPPAIRAITQTLERAGHEAWCVGGAVRDALLGIETLDWDVATSARPEQVQKLFKRTIPVGIQFGTVGVLDADGVLHEVTTFRHDVETDGRHAVVKFGASLEEDLARRDFTINAIAVHAETLELRDPFDGRADLERRVVRCVGDAQLRMQEDRLRALRALRFAGRFDFALDPDTWQAIRDSAPQLGRLSMERVKQELEKVMEQVARPSVTLERYREAGIFAALVPLLADAPPARFAAVDFLAKPGLARRPDRRMLRLAALFVEPGVAPPRGLEATLKHLKFSNVEARATLALATAAADHPLASIGGFGHYAIRDHGRSITSAEAVAARGGGDHPLSENPERSAGDHPLSENAERSAGDHPLSENPERPVRDHSLSENAERSAGDHGRAITSADAVAARGGGDHPLSENPERPLRDHPLSENPERPTTDHPLSENPERRDADLRRAIARAGRLMVPGLARLLWARAKAEGATAAQGLEGLALYRRALRSAFRDPLSIADLAVDGEDLQRAGVGAGRAMGEMLKHLLDLVLDEPSRNTRETLLAEVQRRLAAP